MTATLSQMCHERWACTIEDGCGGSNYGAGTGAPMKAEGWRMSTHLDQEGQILLVGCIQECLLAAPMCPGGIVANPAVPHDL